VGDGNKNNEEVDYEGRVGTGCGVRRNFHRISLRMGCRAADALNQVSSTVFPEMPGNISQESEVEVAGKDNNNNETIITTA
jgi:hypothetical protein